MRKFLVVAGLLLAVAGCTDSDFSLDSPSSDTHAPEVPSQVAANHATADPSLNTINDSGTHRAAHQPDGWIDSPAGDGNSP